MIRVSPSMSCIRCILDLGPKCYSTQLCAHRQYSNRCVSNCRVFDYYLCDGIVVAFGPYFKLNIFCIRICKSKHMGDPDQLDPDSTNTSQLKMISLYVDNHLPFVFHELADMIPCAKVDPKMVKYKTLSLPATEARRAWSKERRQEG